jgi:hypothetical protein
VLPNERMQGGAISGGKVQERLQPYKDKVALHERNIEAIQQRDRQSALIAGRWPAVSPHKPCLKLRKSLRWARPAVVGGHSARRELAIRYLNPAAENLLAISSKVFAGCPLDWRHRVPGALLAALDSALNHGWGYTGQNIDLRLTAGELLQLNCTVNPVDTPQARLLVELWPIDQQLRATREERLVEQQHANRELISNLVHEIKNPLGRHPRCCAIARARTQQRRSARVHAGHHQGGRSPAGSDAAPAVAAPADAAGAGEHPRDPGTGAQPADRRVSDHADRATRLRHQPAGTDRRPRAVDPGFPEHRQKRRTGDPASIPTTSCRLRARSLCAPVSLAR